MNVAWPYANGPRHIGHVAGFGVPSDVYARYERMKGNDVLMVSGTDEHGTPILVEADKEGVSAQELANRYNRVIAKDLCPSPPDQPADHRLLPFFHTHTQDNPTLYETIQQY